MTATVRSATVVGVEAVPIWIEVDIARGLPQFTVVGLPDSGVRESRERVRSALRNAGYPFPLARITVNLAPSHLRKAGSSFDLPIALGILAAQGVVPQEAVANWVILGELALDGSVRPVRGALCTAALLETQDTLLRLMLPQANDHEASLLPRVEVAAVSTLREAVETLLGSRTARPPAIADTGPKKSNVQNAPSDPVIGQEAAKRALEIALAGGHNVLMIGPPGSGKTLLSEWMLHLLPPLTEREVVEVNRIYSAAGLLDSAEALHWRAPVRSPHHTITTRAMIGGGNPPAPGELSLAHRGLLILDEMALFRRATLDALREPLEQGFVRLAHAGAVTLLPARVSVIGAANPCPCGWLGDARHQCICTPAEITRYRKRISGPLLDRMDMVLEVVRTPLEEVHGTDDVTRRDGESLLAVRRRIAKTRQVQRKRNRDGELNAFQRVDLVEALAALAPTSRRLLTRIGDRYGLTGRGLMRIVRVARTIADLNESESIDSVHIAEAAAYRLPSDWGAAARA